jgi:hypothetical protein
MTDEVTIPLAMLLCGVASWMHKIFGHPLGGGPLQYLCLSNVSAAIEFGNQHK